MCLRGPRLLAEHFFQTGPETYENLKCGEIFPVITWDYCLEVNQVKFPKDFSQCMKQNHQIKEILDEALNFQYLILVTLSSQSNVAN